MWASYGIGKTKIHPQLVAHVAFGAETLAITALRTGHAWGSPEVNLSDLGKGILRVQCDTIVEKSSGQAPMIGQEAMSLK